MSAKKPWRGMGRRTHTILVLIPVMALATGMSPIVGQNWGAKLFDRVDDALSKGLMITVCWCGFVAIILFVFAHQIAGIFSSDDKVIKVAVLYMWIVPITLYHRRSWPFGACVQRVGISETRLYCFKWEDFCPLHPRRHDRKLAI